MNNQYYVMRHGESVANREGIIISATQVAINQYGLTTKGVEQVHKAIEKVGLQADSLIISSDFLRARETAEIVHKAINSISPIEYRRELRERCFGDWHLTEDWHYDLVWRNDEKHPQTKANGVETVDQILLRVKYLINDLEHTHQDRTILLVGHGDVLQILICHFKAIKVRFHRSLTSLNNAEIRALPND